MTKKAFWPDFRIELCTPGLNLAQKITIKVLRIGCSDPGYEFESGELAKWSRQTGVIFTN
jgi:hypothetical protein